MKPSNADFYLLDKVNHLQKQKEHDIKNEYIFSNYSFDKIPDREFTLTAFGLKEPASLQVPWYSDVWYLIVAGLGILFLVAAIVLKRSSVLKDSTN